jgi:hypothetical protein
MIRKFSVRFEKYEDWLAQAPASSYTNRIKRLHALYPEAILSQLRGHERKEEVPPEKRKPKAPYERGLTELTPREKSLSERSLKVVSSMRRDGSSLSYWGQRPTYFVALIIGMIGLVTIIVLREQIWSALAMPGTSAAVALVGVIVMILIAYRGRIKK